MCYDYWGAEPNVFHTTLISTLARSLLPFESFDSNLYEACQVTMLLGLWSFFVFGQDLQQNAGQQPPSPPLSTSKKLAGANPPDNATLMKVLRFAVETRVPEGLSKGFLLNLPNRMTISDSRPQGLT